MESLLFSMGSKRKLIIEKIEEWVTVFFLSDVENKSYKNFKLKKIDAVEIESRQLQVNCELTLLRDELELKTSNEARLPYLDVIKYCSKTDNEIINFKKEVVLYKLFL